jgi:K+-transporting ATPase A subunit
MKISAKMQTNIIFIVLVIVLITCSFLTGYNVGYSNGKVDGTQQKFKKIQGRIVKIIYQEKGIYQKAKLKADNYERTNKYN